MRRYVPAVVALLAMLWLGPGTARAAPASRGTPGSASERQATRTQQVAKAAVALKKLGLYQGDASGKWCPELHEAVRAFQKNHGLKVTGRLNLDTRVALGLEEARSKPSRAGATGRSEGAPETP